MSVKFHSLSHGTTIEVQNPERDDALDIDLHQVLNFTADGEPNVYELGVTEQRVRLRWNELRQVEKDDLESFWEDTAEGAKNLVYYQDHRSVWWNARFLNTRLEWTCPDDYEASSDTMTIDEVAYPTTQREKGIWSVEIVLLLSAEGSTTAAATTTAAP